ncbi:S-adenosyl-L-methionine-dependent methyltransferase [Neohortaea acidophila]|uniref:S-adenosyl-L-methionine-dependent methyltransferase n=1 Tax=Neohortaea acidophila TaxID=245834 RepID=A0A6A6PSL2_9PEZI|nr:S-adenosyl-L-methionine-dependent methyltransferase [Neohortaea acidophila]KAF2483090.1 S-adenosyl-L-methionine-dependent methyltransferase [Neohortaea acidophila]
MAQKRPFNHGGKHFKKSKKQKKSSGAGDGSNEEVLLLDVQRVLRDVKIRDSAPPAPEPFAEVDLTISELSSTGDGLAIEDGQVYVVPFTAPGDTVLAKVYKAYQEDSYSLTDLVKITSASQHRTETPKCPYFSRCSGCQFQHLPYAYQLAHKRRVVEKAYENFSNLPASAVPEVGDTIASPLQYGYRTKLTPHFDGPPSGRRDRRSGQKVTWPEVPPIGYMQKGTRKTLDIEDCPIGTDAVREGLKKERVRVAEHIDEYQRGATLLLRESTTRETKTDEEKSYVDEKTCITDHNATSTEYVDDFRFDNPAGSFFQNNNSILPVVTQYVRDNILGPTSNDQPPITNLIDAYCGSGFFTVTLSSLFNKCIGIDISPQSITYASANAKLNNLAPDSTQFIAADANQLFDSLDKTRFIPAQTAVVLDPSRKGCDDNFLRQLMDFGAERLCYVSCNVHTQARDIGKLVGGGEDEEGLPRKGMYEIESVRGFDFFPQTSHVESVAILKKR